MGKTGVIDVTVFLRVKSAWHLGLAFGGDVAPRAVSLAFSWTRGNSSRSGLIGHGIQKIMGNQTVPRGATQFCIPGWPPRVWAPLPPTPGPRAPVERWPPLMPSTPFPSSPWASCPEVLPSSASWLATSRVQGTPPTNRPSASQLAGLL